MSPPLKGGRALYFVEKLNEQHSSVTHSIERTSPKGTDFIGRCVLCGKDNLNFKDARRAYVLNPERKQEHDVIIDAITGHRGLN